MDDSCQSPSRLTMYLAVKAVCDAKPAVWQRSEAFEEAFNDFCRCIENILRLRPAADMFNTVAKGMAVEMEVADTILTTDMDELIEQFEAVDEGFVDDYTTARSMEVPAAAPPGGIKFQPFGRNWTWTEKTSLVGTWRREKTRSALLLRRWRRC